MAKVNLPKVDNGTLYPEIKQYIKNGKFVFDSNKQLTVKAFEKLLDGSKFFKIAEAVLNTKENFPKSNRNFIDGPSYEGKLVDYIPVSGKEDLWKATEKEWAYLIVYAGKIVKIGMTSSGLAARYGSYNCGTKKAMRKGSCSTTNFVITESNYAALLQDIPVEIYAYEIPAKITEEVIFGRTKKVLNKMAHKYESTLIEIYEENTKEIPPLCKACGPSN